MTRLIPAILPTISRQKDIYSQLVSSRFFNLFTPIQAVPNQKSSDLGVYLLLPLIDHFCLRPIFCIDVIINLCNAVASFIEAIFLFCIRERGQQVPANTGSKKAIDEAGSYIADAFLAAMAFGIADFLYMMSYITRPLASLAYYLEVRERAQEQQQVEVATILSLLPNAGSGYQAPVHNQQGGRGGLPYENGQSNRKPAFKAFTGESHTLGS